ncbi:hypothetical protein Tco_0683069 [Tanacetum coccineum]|uniref:Uncharacterized protein n=1 Tax=Tanacetum coccineum TaxID=301880 RepID=A0ABQ4XT62_9ASTR
MLELMLICSSWVRLMLERHHSSRISLVHGVEVVWKLDVKAPIIILKWGFLRPFAICVQKLGDREEQLYEYDLMMKIDQKELWEWENQRWIIPIFEEGEPVDTAFSGATASRIGAMTYGACKSTLVEGLSDSSNIG